MKKPQRAKGKTLDVLALNIGLERIRRHKRVWWKLWLGWRDESDSEFRARMVEWLRLP